MTALQLKASLFMQNWIETDPTITLIILIAHCLQLSQGTDEDLDARVLGQLLGGWADLLPDLRNFFDPNFTPQWTYELTAGFTCWIITSLALNLKLNIFYISLLSGAP